MIAVVTKADLSPARTRLVELMQGINYGRIEGLSIRHGEPVMDPPPSRVLRDFKPGGENGQRSESHLDDFALKKEVAELLDHIAVLGNATIHCLDVRQGLPLKWTVEEVSA